MGAAKFLGKVPGMWLNLPFLVSFLSSSRIGRDYGVGAVGKLRLMAAFRRNNKGVETLSRLAYERSAAA